MRWRTRSPTDLRRQQEAILMEQRYIDLYDEFTHTTMPRRVFMERLTKMAGSTAAATARQERKVIQQSRITAP